MVQHLPRFSAIEAVELLVPLSIFDASYRIPANISAIKWRNQFSTNSNIAQRFDQSGWPPEPLAWSSNIGTVMEYWLAITITYHWFIYKEYIIDKRQSIKSGTAPAQKIVWLVSQTYTLLIVHINIYLYNIQFKFSHFDIQKSCEHKRWRATRTGIFESKRQWYSTNRTIRLIW